jgi:hypothetical protein
MLTKEIIINTLREPSIKKQLMNTGIRHLWLFGSHAK